MFKIIVYTHDGVETFTADGYYLEAHGTLTVFWMGSTKPGDVWSKQVAFAAGRWFKVEQDKSGKE